MLFVRLYGALSVALEVEFAIYLLSSSNILIYFRASSNLCFLVSNVDRNESPQKQPWDHPT